MTDFTQNLPNELLEEVIRFALASDECMPYLCLYRTFYTSVCRRWREISIADPRLWTFVVIEKSRQPLPSVPFLQLCIKRSRNLPLTVQIDGSFRKHSWPSERFWALVEVLKAEIHRWGSFTFKSQPHGIMPLKMLYEFKLNFPLARQLQSVVIDVEKVHLRVDCPPNKLYAQLQDSPSLRKVAIYSWDVFGAGYRILLSHQTAKSWARWTHVKLRTDMVWEDVALLLNSCPNVRLMHLTLYQRDRDTEFPNSISIPLYVTHNNLRALDLNLKFYEKSFTSLISTLEFPCLEIFHFGRYGTEEHMPPHPPDYAYFYTMISRSTRLQVLIMSHSIFDQEALLDFISHPTIVRISTVQVMVKQLELRGYDPAINKEDLYKELVARGPEGLIRVVDLWKEERFLVGWVERWIMLKNFEGLGTLDDAGFLVADLAVLHHASHPTRGQLSQPISAVPEAYNNIGRLLNVKEEKQRVIGR